MRYILYKGAVLLAMTIYVIADLNDYINKGCPKKKKKWLQDVNEKEYNNFD